MITCNHCGYKSPERALNCPKCGAPLLDQMESSGYPRPGGQEQSEIPAWLESLRVGERPAAPTNTPSHFSTADLIEEGTLPPWMRSERAMTPGIPASDAVHPFQSPPANQANMEGTSRGLNAQSLIDEGSLPSWMRGKDSSSSSRPQDGFDATSLVEQDALPDWMKSLRPQEPSSQNAQAAPSVSSNSPIEEVHGRMKSVQPQSPAWSEPSSEAMPSWMKNLQPQREQGAYVPSSGELSQPSAKGFSASDLLDEQSLPSWMAQQGQDVATPGNRPAQPGTFSPSSLIDKDVLPSWIGESGRAQQRVPPSQSQSAVPDSSQRNAFSQGQGIAGSSFIDANSLPDWLRSSAGQPAGVSPMQQGDKAYNPSRVENMRVPSRPRNDINADENNEAAANAFASMLGVASTTPQFPGTPPPPSPYSSPQQPAQAMSGVPPQGSWYSGGMGQSGYGTGPYDSGNNMPGRPPQYPPQGGGMPPVPATPAPSGEQRNGKKRGLVDTLLGWLLH